MPRISRSLQTPTLLRSTSKEFTRLAAVPVSLLLFAYFFDILSNLIIWNRAKWSHTIPAMERSPSTSLSIIRVLGKLAVEPLTSHVFASVFCEESPVEPDVDYFVIQDVCPHRDDAHGGALPYPVFSLSPAFS